MTQDAALVLHRAVLEVLRADAELGVLLGGARVYDRPPRRLRPPYVTLGEIVSRDRNTFDARGERHVVTLHAWSEQGGRRQAFEIVGRMDAVLDDAPLALDGHRLVEVRTVFRSVVRMRDGRLFHGILRLEAITHPLV